MIRPLQRKRRQVYTGDEIIGIAQMHKTTQCQCGKKQATEVATRGMFKCELKFVIIILMEHSCVLKRNYNKTLFNEMRNREAYETKGEKRRRKKASARQRCSKRTKRRD